MKILIVDDEREEREGIAYVLEKYGYPVEAVQASNGAEASEYIRSHEIDILFTDVRMPIMNGQALEANAVSYLLKPIEIEEFRKLMDDVIDSINKRKELHERKRQDDRQNRKNLLYKLFTSARAHEKEEERLRKILFPE